jgi:hypothetical protein
MILDLERNTIVDVLTEHNTMVHCVDFVVEASLIEHIGAKSVLEIGTGAVLCMIRNKELR